MAARISGIVASTTVNGLAAAGADGDADGRLLCADALTIANAIAVTHPRANTDFTMATRL
jgi:leucyl aminopeptidase